MPYNDDDRYYEDYEEYRESKRLDPRALRTTIVAALTFVIVSIFLLYCYYELPEPLYVEYVDTVNRGGNVLEDVYHYVYASPAEERQAAELDLKSFWISIVSAIIMGVITHFIFPPGKVIKTSVGMRIMQVSCILIIAAVMVVSVYGAIANHSAAKEIDKNKAGQTEESDFAKPEKKKYKDSELIKWDGCSYEVSNGSEVNNSNDSLLQNEKVVIDSKGDVIIRSFCIYDDGDIDNIIEVLYEGYDYEAQEKTINGINGRMISDTTVDTEGNTLYRKNFMYVYGGATYFVLLHSYDEEYNLEDHMVYQTLKIIDGGSNVGDT